MESTLSRYYKILALDQALGNTGYALIDAGGEQISFGLITTIKANTSKKSPCSFSDWERMSYVSSKICELVNFYNVDAVVLETPFVRQKFKSSLQLQQVYAVLQVALLEKSLAMPQIKPCLFSIDTITPKSWVKALDLKSTKAPLLKTLKNRNPNLKITNHESDALGIGLGHLVSTKLLTLEEANAILNGYDLKNTPKCSLTCKPF